MEFIIAASIVTLYGIVIDRVTKRPNFKPGQKDTAKNGSTTKTV
jgi:hypothetical protein